MIKTLTNDVIDIWLKHTGGTSETKGYDKIFEVTIMEMESGLQLVVKHNIKAIEGVRDIYFGEIFCIFHTIQ